MHCTSVAPLPLVARTAAADRAPRRRASQPARRAARRPSHATFVRRRIVVLTLLMIALAGSALSARHALADRGGPPAPVPAVGQPSDASLTGAGGRLPVLADGSYLVRPGDSLWSIAERWTGGHDVADAVDVLVARHGSATITPGERLQLP